MWRQQQLNNKLLHVGKHMMKLASALWEGIPDGKSSNFPASTRNENKCEGFSQNIFIRVGTFVATRVSTEFPFEKSLWQFDGEHIRRINKCAWKWLTGLQITKKWITDHKIGSRLVTVIKAFFFSLFDKSNLETFSKFLHNKRKVLMKFPEIP